MCSKENCHDENRSNVVMYSKAKYYHDDENQSNLVICSKAKYYDKNPSNFVMYSKATYLIMIDLIW